MNQGEHRLWGPPGTGKTTKVADIVGDIVRSSGWTGEGPGPVVVSSLTRAAAHEVVKRGLPIASFQVGTLHALAYHSIGCPAVSVESVCEWNEEHPGLSLTDDGRHKAVDDLMPDEPVGQRPGDEIHAKYQLYRARMIDRQFWPPSVQRFAELWEVWKAAVGVIDFADMIDIALKEVAEAPGSPSTVIGDECQDYDAQEMALIRKWGTAAGRTILAGDPDQSIYVWRGADPQLFFDERVPLENRKLLTRSYRVPRAVLDVALEFRNQLTDCQPLEYKPRVYDPKDPKSEEVLGEVYTSQSTCQQLGTKLIDFIADEVSNDKSVMLIASCGYMLDGTKAALRRAGIPFCNPWRKTRGDWNPLRASKTSMVERILALLRPHAAVYTGKDGTRPARRWDGGELKCWASVLNVRGVLRRGAKTALKDMDETTGVVSVEALKEIFEPNALDDLNELLDPWVEPELVVKWYSDHVEKAKQGTAEYVFGISDRFGVESLRQAPKCYLGTIHSVKGAEADTVILFPDLSPAAAEEWSSSSGRNSVIRTFYVGITRARERLIVCNSAGYTSQVEIPLQSAECFESR